MGSNTNSSTLKSKEKELETARGSVNSDEDNKDSADNSSDNSGEFSADNNNNESDDDEDEDDDGEEAEEDSDATDEPQQTAEEEEDEAEYIKGGYHPVSIGDVYSTGRYHVLRKLGWGHFSTVWLAKDQKQPQQEQQSPPVVALKIVKSAQHYSETAIDEIKLLEKVVNANPNNQNRRKIVELKDWFKIKGPNGSHVTMAFEVLGPNLLTLIRQYHHRGIPVPIVKRIMKQVLQGLQYLHDECHIIHTDLKPENVLICVDVDETLQKLGLAPKEIEPSTATPPTVTTTGMSKSQKKKARQKASAAAKANKQTSTKNDM
ncbi:serine/threonine protein kinase, CMGC group [Physocladia obscura]|uniref:non-specific serine/threonine protein kinase n=1 Tax=Physocladia obscura TaxID=109957 RepID=A0AAD5XBT5_9FUNG|nr:serine/threonine protein kinase, CMGC group [Physocladia obscura]